MMGTLQAAWVIARRDFAATVYSRSFILFMLTPLLVFGFSLVIGLSARSSAMSDVPKVAIVTDTASAQALIAARDDLASATNERLFPQLKRVDATEDARAQARILIADRAQDFSAVISGSLDRPIVSGPQRIDDNVGKRIQLIVDRARASDAMRTAGPDAQLAPIERDVTTEAAGNLRDMRKDVARFGQFFVFFFTLLLATMLLSNLVEEKSNKVIEVLAAAVPVDAIFLGKLLAMLGVSLVGIALWGGMAGLAFAFSVQLLPEGMSMPDISPAIGWPIYAVLLPIYYGTNYLLLGCLFLGIGGQANSVREVQTLNMPVTFLQMGMLVLGMTVIGNQTGFWPTAAYIFPFSSPLAMIAEAGQSDQLWPHLLAIPWQFLWVFILIRISAALFRRTVLKSGGEMRIMPRFSLGKRGKA